VERNYTGPARVSGSAGTGKTIVALHRAVFLARNHPQSRVILATFSETLANALRTKLRRLISHEPHLAERLEVHALPAVGERLYESAFCFGCWVLGCKLGRCLVIQGPVRPLVVIVVAPCGQLSTDLGHLKVLSWMSPNPPLDSDPACIAFRALSAFRFLGLPQPVGGQEGQVALSQGLHGPLPPEFLGLAAMHEAVELAGHAGVEGLDHEPDSTKNRLFERDAELEGPGSLP